MGTIKKINYYELLGETKKLSSPFSRELFVSSIKEDIGSGVMIKYDMGNGIAIFTRSFKINRDLILIEESNISAGVFIFNLGGNLLFKYSDKREYLLETNYFTTAMASNNFSSEVKLEKDKTYTTITIGMKEELFLNLTNKFDNLQEYLKQVEKHNYAILNNSQIDPRQLNILSYFKTKNSYENLLKNLFIESKISDLSHYTIKRIINSSINTKNINLEKDRVKSLQKAKEIIIKEYFKNDLSIKTIAYKAATNECYLKKDFKLYYGMTIYEMLQKQRMQIAKELLQKGLSVKEIAQKVGYKHSGNFSKIFFKYFKIMPSDYKKQFLDY